MVAVVAADHALRHRLSCIRVLQSITLVYHKGILGTFSTGVITCMSADVPNNQQSNWGRDICFSIYLGQMVVHLEGYKELC